VPRQLGAHGDERATGVVVVLLLHGAFDGTRTGIGRVESQTFRRDNWDLLYEHVNVTMGILEVALDKAWIVLVHKAHDLNRDSRHW